MTCRYARMRSKVSKQKKGNHRGRAAIFTIPFCHRSFCFDQKWPKEVSSTLCERRLLCQALGRKISHLLSCYCSSSSFANDTITNMAGYSCHATNYSKTILPQMVKSHSSTQMTYFFMIKTNKRLRDVASEWNYDRVALPQQ